MRMPPAFYDKDYLKTTVRARGRGSRERGCRATVHSVAHVAAGGIEEEMDKKRGATMILIESAALPR